MSRIHSKDTLPELVVRRYLFSKGFRYKIHDKKLPGCPDIVLPRLRVVVFVHGCFWHGHSGCKYAVIPKTRREWWMKKIERTKFRDHSANEMIVATGYRVIEIFECQLRNEFREQTLEKLIKTLRE